MQTLKMKTELLDEFVESLRNWGRVWAPVARNDGLFSLEVVDDDVDRCEDVVLPELVDPGDHQHRRGW